MPSVPIVNLSIVRKTDGTIVILIIKQTGNKKEKLQQIVLTSEEKLFITDADWDDDCIQKK